MKSDGLTTFEIREIVGKLECLLLDKDINIYPTEKELHYTTAPAEITRFWREFFVCMWESDFISLWGGFL